MVDIDFTIVEQKDNDSIFPKATIKVKPILHTHYDVISDTFDSIKCTCPICNAAKRGQELSLYHSKITQCPQWGVNLDWSKYEEKCKGLGVSL